MGSFYFFSFVLFIYILVVILGGLIVVLFWLGGGGGIICFGENEVFTKLILPDNFIYLDKSYFLARLQLIEETEEWDRFLLSSVRMNIDTDLGIHLGWTVSSFF